MRVCTIAAANYIARVRVLAASFLEHHPGASFTLLLIDDPDGEVDLSHEPFATLRPADLGLDPTRLGRMAAYYTVTEFSTALKPPLLRFLLDRDGGPVTYLDPDIAVYHPFDEVDSLASEHGIVVVPHMRTPIPRDGLMPCDSDILGSGAFNLGYLTVSSAATDFLSWWGEHLVMDAIVRPSIGLFTDQRWVDLAPTLYGVHVIEDPGFDVAFWNLHERDVERTDSGWLVDGYPLRFFHFSGFDPLLPHVVCKYHPRPRILLSERPGVARIYGEYADALLATMGDGIEKRPYGYSRLSNGLVLDDRIRRIYHEAVETEARGGESAPPSPFGPASEGPFTRWLARRDAVNGLTRVLSSIWSWRADLMSHFPDPLGVDRQRFFDWIDTYGAREEPNLPANARILEEHAPPLAPTGPRPVVRPIGPGVNVVGYFESEIGLGAAGRTVVRSLEASGLPTSVVVTRDHGARQRARFDRDRRADPPSDRSYDITVVCRNAVAMPPREGELRHVLVDRHIVGFWFWEIEKVPAAVGNAFATVDELWAASRFMHDTFSRVGRVPVHEFPYPFTIPARPTRLTRRDLGLPDDFLFLFMFDLGATLERKNALGLIEAFAKAFHPGEAVLYIKVVNEQHFVNDAEKLRLAALEYPHVQIATGFLTPVETLALVDLADCYVSLHRSEGLGLTMAEAMAAGKPVVATAYSGNLSFMTEDTSLLVPVRKMIPVGPDSHPYPADALWADPDLEVAAAHMRRVFEDRAGAAALGARARAHLAAEHGVDRTVRFLRRRLDEIRSTRRSR